MTNTTTTEKLLLPLVLITAPLEAPPLLIAQRLLMMLLMLLMRLLLLTKLLRLLLKILDQLIINVAVSVSVVRSMILNERLVVRTVLPPLLRWIVSFINYCKYLYVIILKRHLFS